MPRGGKRQGAGRPRAGDADHKVTRVATCFSLSASTVKELRRKVKQYQRSAFVDAAILERLKLKEP
jgi:hypothetical protein